MNGGIPKSDGVNSNCSACVAGDQEWCPTDKKCYLLNAINNPCGCQLLGQSCNCVAQNEFSLCPIDIVTARQQGLCKP